MQLLRRRAPSLAGVFSLGSRFSLADVEPSCRRYLVVSTAIEAGANELIVLGLPASPDVEPVLLGPSWVGPRHDIPVVGPGSVAEQRSRSDFSKRDQL
jgi:hypothetical protein